MYAEPDQVAQHLARPVLVRPVLVVLVSVVRQERGQQAVLIPEQLDAVQQAARVRPALPAVEQTDRREERVPAGVVLSQAAAVHLVSGS